jgi:hypothetical protein
MYVGTTKLFNKSINTHSNLIKLDQKLHTSCESTVTGSIQMNQISEESIYE